MKYPVNQISLNLAKKKHIGKDKHAADGSTIANRLTFQSPIGEDKHDGFSFDEIKHANYRVSIPHWGR